MTKGYRRGRKGIGLGFGRLTTKESEASNAQHSNLVCVAPAAVATEGAAQACEEGEEEGNERTEDHPVGVAPGGVEAAIAHVAAGDAEEDHLDDPHDEGDEEGEGADEGHEDGAHAVVGGTAEAEEDGEARETGAWKDQGLSAPTNTSSNMKWAYRRG